MTAAPEEPMRATCPVCGRPLVRRTGEYELGRRGGGTVRWVGKWWHDGTTIEACAEPEEPAGG